MMTAGEPLLLVLAALLSVLALSQQADARLAPAAAAVAAIATAAVVVTAARPRPVVVRIPAAAGPASLTAIATGCRCDRPCRPRGPPTPVA